MSSSILPRRFNRRHSSRRGNRLLPSFFAPQLTRESIGPPEPNTQVQHRGWYRVEVLSGWPGAVPGGVEVPAVVDVKMQRQEWIPLDLTATDQTTDVATTDGGNMVYISGVQQAPPDADGVQRVEAFLMAYNSSGSQQWAVTYGTSGYDLGNSVAADTTGVYLAGTASVVRNTDTMGTGVADDVDTDAFIVKYNSTGGLLWERSWGTSEPDLGNGVAVDDGSGLVYVVGTTRGAMDAEVSSPDSGNISPTSAGTTEEGQAEQPSMLNAGMSDVFLTCLGAEEGDIRWTVQFGSAAADVGNRVAVGPRGGVFLVGQLGDDDDPPLSSARAFLAKYDYLGNAQFNARLNSSSTHFAVDLAPSLGSGGEGVVYMSGYSMGDSGEMFLARFEGSTGTQTWLRHFGGEGGSAHRAQSVSVVERRHDDTGLMGGAISGSASDSGTGPGTPVVDQGSFEAGRDARILVVGYNISAASAESHTSTGFTVAADTEGTWVWQAVDSEAEKETAIAIGTSGRAGGGGGGAEVTSAYIVGTVSASKASPGNYLFLDIQEIVRQGVPTPGPSVVQRVTMRPTLAPHSIGDASATTGLSQGASLWLLIIAPIFVVVSCIMMVGYVSKQCAIAFGSSPHDMDGGNRGALDCSTHDDGQDHRDRYPRRSIHSVRHSNGSGAHSSGGGGDGEWHDKRGPTTNEGTNTFWPHTIAAALRKKEAGPPYRKLGSKKQGHIPLRRGGSEDEEGPGDIEMHGAEQRTPFSVSPHSNERAGVAAEVCGSDDLGVDSRDRKEIGALDFTAELGEDRGSSRDRGLRNDRGWGSVDRDDSVVAHDVKRLSRTNENPADHGPEGTEVHSPLNWRANSS